jgi:hypothetical protein
MMATHRQVLSELCSATIEAIVAGEVTERLHRANTPAIQLISQEPDVLDGIDETRELLSRFNSMVLLDTMAEYLGEHAQTDSARFEVEVLERAIKQIRKSRGLSD